MVLSRHEASHLANVIYFCAASSRVFSKLFSCTENRGKTIFWLLVLHIEHGTGGRPPQNSELHSMCNYSYQDKIKDTFLSFQLCKLQSGICLQEPNLAGKIAIYVQI